MAHRPHRYYSIPRPLDDDFSGTMAVGLTRLEDVAQKREERRALADKVRTLLGPTPEVYQRTVLIDTEDT